MMKIFISLFSFFLIALSAVAQAPEKAEDISPLLIGEKLPEAKLLDTKGKEVVLSALITKKPTVLVFYRGGWCPYCNRHLGALAEMEGEILELGFQIIAISPDDYQNLSSTLEEDKVSYQVFSDPGAKFIQDLGIAFAANDRTKEYISKKTKGKVTELLPVPTVMVINTQGDIVFEYINPNYANRMSGKLLISVLKGLQD